MKRLMAVKILIFMIMAVFFYAGGASAQNEGFFSQANTAYKEGRYDAAIESYEKLIALGFESGNLYYNLGNSYFKKGEAGFAILNYERAKLFIPNDSDLKSNYDYALASLNLSSQFPGNRFERAVNRIFEGTTIDSLTILLSMIYICAIALLMLCLFIHRFKKLFVALLLACLVLFTLSALSLHSKIIELNTGAIVIAKEADVKFEPLDSATTYFKLPEGSKTAVMETSGNWCKIKRPDGKLGWLNKAAIAMIGIHNSYAHTTTVKP